MLVISDATTRASLPVVHDAKDAGHDFPCHAPADGQAVAVRKIGRTAVFAGQLLIVS